MLPESPGYHCISLNGKPCKRILKKTYIYLHGQESMPLKEQQEPQNASSKIGKP